MSVKDKYEPVRRSVRADFWGGAEKDMVRLRVLEQDGSVREEDEDATAQDIDEGRQGISDVWPDGRNKGLMRRDTKAASRRRQA